MRTSLRALRIVVLIACSAMPAVRNADAQTILYRIPGTDAGAGSGRSIETLEIPGGSIIAIGTPDHDEPGQVAIGKVDVFDARTGVLLYTITGSAAGDRYGVRVSKGDVNGDGVDDLIVGADQGGAGGYVDARDPLTDGVLILRYLGTSPLGGIGGGITVAIGDRDGDGLSELAAGSPMEDSPVLPRTGAVHVISSLTGSDIATLYGGSTDARFGGGVSLGHGDVEGDGVDDLVIGAPGDAGVGSVSCYSGATLQFIWQCFGSAAGDDFGAAVAILDYDFDGDGIPDIAIGSPRTDSPVPTSGEMDIVSGATGCCPLCGPPNLYVGHDDFGISIDFGDIDHDGVPEIFVGAPASDTGGVGRGRVDVFQMDTNLNPPMFVQIAEIAGGADGDGFGSYVRRLKDYRGIGSSGNDGMVVDAGGSDAGATDGGAAAICSVTDQFASATNYGSGWPGTLGIPGIGASNPPSFGAPITITIDNSSTSATLGLLLVGFAETSIPTNAGGTILVAPPWLVLPLPLPVGQLVAAGSIPIDLRLCGLELDLQCLELDPGASRHLSFTPGLALVLGG